MNRYDAFLIKYAEIGIKGKNRHVFEEALVRQIRIALRPCEGHFNVIRTYGRVFVEAKSEFDFEEVTGGPLPCLRYLGDLPGRRPRADADRGAPESGSGLHGGGVSGREVYV